MPERLRSLFARVREIIGNRRRPPRRVLQLKTAVHLVNVVHAKDGREQVLNGYTQDVSSQGVSFVVPAIRLGTDYLIGDNRKLRLRLELPNAPIEFVVLAVRYHQLEADDVSGTSFLVGARITEIKAEAKQKLNDFLSSQK